MPVVNGFVNDNLLNPDYFPHYNLDLQDGVDVYPGELDCNPAPLPHAKWHLQTGIALVDFAHLSNLLNKVVMSQGTTTVGGGGGETSTSTTTTGGSGGEDTTTDSASGLTSLGGTLIVAVTLMSLLA